MVKANTRNACPNQKADYDNDMKLVVGLGNPGRQYTGTRHNLGFMCVDELSGRWEVALSDKRKHVVIGQGIFHDTEFVLAKPRTFMNDSGVAINYLLTRFGNDTSDLLIIYDDMDLPLGQIRIRPSGGSAGQKGARSIIETVGTTDFARLRIGIGEPGIVTEAIPFLLSPFSADEQPMVRDAVHRAAAAVECLFIEGIDIAMNKFN